MKKKASKGKSEKVVHKRTSGEPSYVIQFGVVFVIVAAMVLIAYVAKYYTAGF